MNQCQNMESLKGEYSILQSLALGILRSLSILGVGLMYQPTECTLSDTI